jgi:hypothetical protein
MVRRFCLASPIRRRWAAVAATAIFVPNLPFTRRIIRKTGSKNGLFFNRSTPIRDFSIVYREATERPIES